MQVCNYVPSRKIKLICTSLIFIFAVLIFSHEVSAGAITKIKITQRTGTDTDGVASASCGNDERVVGGGCNCTGFSSDNEAGILFGCYPAGNGYVGGCYPYDLNQTNIPIEVDVICMKTIPAKAISSKSSVDSDSSVKSKVEASAKSSKSPEVIELENKYRKMIEDHRKTLIK